MAARTFCAYVIISTIQCQCRSTTKQNLFLDITDHFFIHNLITESQRNNEYHHRPRLTTTPPSSWLRSRPPDCALSPPCFLASPLAPPRPCHSFLRTQANHDSLSCHRSLRLLPPPLHLAAPHPSAFIRSAPFHLRPCHVPACSQSVWAIAVQRSVFCSLFRKSF